MDWVPGRPDGDYEGRLIQERQLVETEQDRMLLQLVRSGRTVRRRPDTEAAKDYSPR
ncbi:MAG: hypothetical protein ACYTBJ_08275 [Planctomycetota bacterium]